MTKQDRQKLSILAVLLAVLSVTMVLGYRMIQPPAIAPVQVRERKASSNLPPASEGQIRLDRIERSEAPEEDVARRNIFQYQEAPPPPAPFPPPRGGSSIPLSPLTGSGPAPPVAPRPPLPPAQPTIPLKYQGFAATGSANGGLIAFVADDARHYNVTAGEILMGRYRIVSITEKAVEVEDLEYNRRQTLPRLK